ncbi:hypothetical protein SK128_015612, partial [Halocaridina rubra]
VSELLALVSVTSTCMLFLHTSHLQSQLDVYTNHLDEGSQHHSAAVGSSSRFLSRGDEGVSNSASRTGAGVSSSISHHKPKYSGYNLEDFRHIDPMTLNNTVHHSKLTLFFNRVPKVGSQSTMELLRALSYKNGFTFHKDRPQKVENIKLSAREQ